MHVIVGLLRLLFNFFFFLVLFINVHCYHLFMLFFPLFRISYNLHPSYYQVLKRDVSLPPPAKLTHTSIA